MPGAKQQALRYLLLRFLWSARGFISDETYKEIATSLTVNKSDEGFIVKWMRGGCEFQKAYEKDAFRFYISGDKIRARGLAPTTRRHNALQAKRFVCEALEIDEFKNKIDREPLFSNTVLKLSGYAACASLMWLVGGRELFLVGALILAIFASELWYERGKLLVPILLGVFIVIGFPYTAMVSAFAYSMFQFLDPNKQLRKVRMYLSVSVFGYGLFQILWDNIAPIYDVRIPVIIGIAIATFITHWTAGSHFRYFPLVFPFLCIGMYLDGQVVPAMVGLGWAIIDATLSHIGFHLFPVQKETSLTPNG